MRSLDFDRENRSPKSVLSAVGSDTLGSSDSDTPNGSLSPVSSITGFHTSSFVAAEPKTLLSDEDCLQETGAVTDSAPNQQSPMVLSGLFTYVNTYNVFWYSLKREEFVCRIIKTI